MIQKLNQLTLPPTKTLGMSVASFTISVYFVVM